MKIMRMALIAKQSKRGSIVSGEKLHEQMIGSEDALYNFVEYPDHFQILPSINAWRMTERVGPVLKLIQSLRIAHCHQRLMEISNLKKWIKRIGQNWKDI